MSNRDVFDKFETIVVMYIQRLRLVEALMDMMAAAQMYVKRISFIRVLSVMAVILLSGDHVSSVSSAQITIFAKDASQRDCMRNTSSSSSANLRLAEQDLG